MNDLGDVIPRLRLDFRLPLLLLCSVLLLTLLVRQSLLELLLLLQFGLGPCCRLRPFLILCRARCERRIRCELQAEPAARTAAEATSISVFTEARTLLSCLVVSARHLRGNPQFEAGTLNVRVRERGCYRVSLR